MVQSHKEANAAISSFITSKEERLEQAIREFHDMIDTIEVNKQLQGIILLVEVLTPSAIKYKLKERATVAKLFFKPIDKSVKSSKCVPSLSEVLSNFAISKRLADNIRCQNQGSGNEMYMRMSRSLATFP